MFAGRKSNLLYNFLCHVLNEKKTFKKKFRPVFNQNEYKIYLFYIDYFTIRINIHISCSFLLNSRVSNRCMNGCLSALSIRICLLSENFTPMDGNSIRMPQENIHMQACMRKRNISRAITLGQTWEMQNTAISFQSCSFVQNLFYA